MSIINIDDEKRAAERYVSVSKRNTKTYHPVITGSDQGVKTSPMQQTITTQTTHPLSKEMQLQIYLKNIGMQ
jgi:hypothetical protein